MITQLLIVALALGEQSLGRPDQPYDPSATASAPVGLANCGFVETTWADPKWVLATSDHILRAKKCLAEGECSPTGWFDRVEKEPCHSSTRFFRFEPGRKTATAFTMAALGSGTFDGIYVRGGHSFQLYGADCTQLVGSKTKGPKYISLEHWASHPSGCGEFEPGTLLLPGGAGALAEYSIVIGKGEVESIEIYHPETVKWKSGDIIDVDDIVFAGQPLKILLALKEPLDDPTELPCSCSLEIRSFNDPSDPEVWFPVEINTDDTLTKNGTHLRLTILWEELIELGVVSSATDSVFEFCSADTSSKQDTTKSNRNDSDAFDDALDSQGVARGRGRGNKTKLKLSPPELFMNKAFVASAGTRLVEVRFGKNTSNTIQVQDQADWFYFSGHGFHDSAKIDTSEGKLKPGGARWGGDVETVFIAGCSVLDINDYNAKFPLGDIFNVFPEANPGLQWLMTGPQVLCGYNWTAPLDHNVGDPDFTAKIISQCINNASTIDIVDAWKKANEDTATSTDSFGKGVPGQRPYNACVIDLRPAGTDNDVYWYFDFGGDVPVWTAVKRSDW